MTFVEPAEQTLVDLLANFARTIGPGAMGAISNIPPELDAVGKPAEAPPPA
jgi:hypothetical protein